MNIKNDVASQLSTINKVYEEEILRRAKKDSKPERVVIKFRNDKKVNKERPTVDVPLECLKFRKDSCRISEYILTHESLNDDINENTAEDQKKIEKLLWNKKSSANKDLLNNIHNNGQDEPGVATADGFMVDGNRRLMILKRLAKEDTSITHMKVVLLPGNKDIMQKVSQDDPDVKNLREDDGIPTIEDIDSTENRYQNEADTKLDYTNWETAHSLFRRMKKGIALKAQLREHSDKSGLSETEMKAVEKEYMKKYIHPRMLVDEYLDFINRPGVYTLALEKGPGFDAFAEHWSRNISKLTDEKKCEKLNIEFDEVSEFKEYCWNMMRVAAPLMDDTKLAQNIRKFLSMWQNKDSQKTLRKSFKSIKLPKETLDPFKYEEDWKLENGAKVKQIFNHANAFIKTESIQETSSNRILEALKKLETAFEEITNMPPSDRDDAYKNCNKIKDTVTSIMHEIENARKKLKNAATKK